MHKANAGDSRVTNVATFTLWYKTFKQRGNDIQILCCLVHNLKGMKEWPHFLLKKPVALLVEDFDKLGLKVLVAVPGTTSDRTIRFKVEKHIHLFFGCLHQRTRKMLFNLRCRECRTSHRRTETDLTALMSFLLSKLFRILLREVSTSPLFIRMSLIQMPT